MRFDSLGSVALSHCIATTGGILLVYCTLQSAGGGGGYKFNADNLLKEQPLENKSHEHRKQTLINQDEHQEHEHTPPGLSTKVVSCV